MLFPVLKADFTMIETYQVKYTMSLDVRPAYVPAQDLLMCHEYHQLVTTTAPVHWCVTMLFNCITYNMPAALWPPPLSLHSVEVR